MSSVSADNTLSTKLLANLAASLAFVYFLSTDIPNEEQSCRAKLSRGIVIKK
jgi:hypothetical protein